MTPREGDIVLYRLPDGIRRGESRPAIIVRLARERVRQEDDSLRWELTEPYEATLHVFIDGTRDFNAHWADAVGSMQVQDARYDPSGRPGSWRPRDWGEDGQAAGPSTDEAAPGAPRES